MELTQINRHNFIRDEKNAFIQIEVKGDKKLPANAIWMNKKITLQPEVINGKKVFKLPVETRLFPGKYQETLNLLDKKYTFSYQIGPQIGDSMPVILWGFKGDHKKLQALGINQGLFYTVLNNTPANFQRLEDAIIDGFRYYGSVTTNHALELKKKYKMIDRTGKAYKHGVDASNENVVKRMLNVIDTQTTLRSHPAVAGALLNSEIRASTIPSFAPHQVNAYKKFSGKDIPKEVNYKTGVPYQQIKNFPDTRVVPDNHPILEYYRWFWNTGDGWNNLNTTMAKALHKNASPNFICFHDPILRTPPIFGSGGKVDIINHWTYGTPEPCRITSHIDCMFEMARYSGQQVWAMTQIICYRSRTANIAKPPKKLPQWAKKHPKATYITIPPDNLQEAIWTMISRPVKGLMFHGHGSLLELDSKKPQRYTMTNPKTQETMKKMITQVVNPLAPMLKRLPEVPSSIAVLHSFTSSMLAERGTWGWRGWEDDVNLMLHYAGLNPKVIYEESILKHNALNKVKILVMPNCDVLSESIVKAVKEFQKKGGIVVGDTVLCPAIVPQVMLNIFKRNNFADSIQNNLYKSALKLRKELRPFVKLSSETNKPELLRYERKWKDASYFFVINDKRTYGDYFGPWKMVMEKGVANQGTLSIYKKAGAVYELSQGEKVKYTTKQNTTQIPLNFNTNDGRIYLVLPSPIAKINLLVPSVVTAGETISVKAEIVGENNKAIQALLPLSFIITDTKGRQLDGGPYGCAINGVWKLETNCPFNAEKELKVVVKDRASGLSAQGIIKVKEAK